MIGTECSHAKALVEDGTVEPLDKAVRLGRLDRGPSMLGAVQIEVEFVEVALGAAELAAVVGEQGFNRQVEIAVERSHVVVQHRQRGFWLLGYVQEAEGIASVSVDHGVEVHLAHALQRADEERVGREQLARRA